MNRGLVIVCRISALVALFYFYMVLKHNGYIVLGFAAIGTMIGLCIYWRPFIPPKKKLNDSPEKRD